jgi:hypothetical protein
MPELLFIYSGKMYSHGNIEIAYHAFLPFNHEPSCEFSPSQLFQNPPVQEGKCSLPVVHAYPSIPIRKRINPACFNNLLETISERETIEHGAMPGYILDAPLRACLQEGLYTKVNNIIH